MKGLIGATPSPGPAVVLADGADSVKMVCDKTKDGFEPWTSNAT